LSYTEGLIFSRRYAKNSRHSLVEYRYFINQIGGAYGSQLKGLPALRKMYEIMLKEIGAGKTNLEVVAGIIADQELSFIREITDDDRRYWRNFSRETSNAIYLREALAKELTCGICHARINSKSITLDHMKRKQDGGDGSLENGKLAHPYCNHGYKEKQTHVANIGA
jgi:hypothetical protein